MTTRLRISGLFRYPVKSMGGESLVATGVGATGLVGDRRYAVLDLETGTIASAKHPRRFARLLLCAARYVEEPAPGGPLPPVRITLPDGAAVRSDDPHVDEALSAALGRAVRLVTVPPDGAARDTDRSPVDRAGSGEVVNREPIGWLAPGTFFDVAPMLVVSTFTLDALAATLPEAVITAPRFRPNVVVTAGEGGPAFDEHAWLGRALALPDGTSLEVIDPCPRCVLTTLPQVGLPAAPGVLKALVAARSATSVTAAPGATLPAVLGVYARVRGDTRLHTGDELVVPA